MSLQQVAVLIIALSGTAWSQYTDDPSYCCYYGNCPYYYPCYQTSTPPYGQASASVYSNGNNPSGELNLGNYAVAGYNQTVGFMANGVTQNNASGPGASVNSNVQVSATNTNVTNPIVSTNAGASSSGSAALGAVNNLDQATSNGNMTSSIAAGQSQLYGNGTAVTGNSGASASASQRKAKLAVNAGVKSNNISHKDKRNKKVVVAFPHHIINQVARRARKPQKAVNRNNRGSKGRTG